MGRQCSASVAELRGSEESIIMNNVAAARNSEHLCGLCTQNSGCTANQEQGELSPHPQAASDSITGRQRAEVVDNMIAIACDLRLSNDVLFLAVAYLDRYLAAVPTAPTFLQPLSIACLWIAAKYESAVVPAAAVFASLVRDPIGSDTISAVDSVKFLVFCEATVLEALSYRLASVDTTKHHLRMMMQRLQTSTSVAGRRSSEQVQQGEQLYCMMSYLAEVGLLEKQLLSTPTIQLAAAAYALAHVLLGRRLDADLLVEITGYTMSQLQTPLQYVSALHTTLVQALISGRPYAVSVKYSAPALHAVAAVAPLCDTRDPRLVL